MFLKLGKIPIWTELTTDSFKVSHAILLVQISSYAGKIVTFNTKNLFMIK